MPRLTKIYTRKGDDGSTALGTGDRVPKDHPQVAAYGEVDELNATLGVALAHGLTDEVSQELLRIQSELFNVGGELCLLTNDPDTEPMVLILPRHIEALEKACDRLNADLGPLDNFILPGGGKGSAFLHVSRVVCRRAERLVVTLAKQMQIPEDIPKYLNRLADLLFIMARYENKHSGVDDVLWDRNV